MAFRQPWHRSLRSGWIAAALLFAALHMLIFDRGLGGDGWAGFALLQSVVDDGDLWLEDDHRGVLNGLVAGRGGHLVSQYPPGILILDAVPFLTGRVLDRVLPAGWLAQGGDLPPVGRVPRGVFLSAAMIVLARNAAALLGLLWIALGLLRLGMPEKVTAAAVVFTFFGGPLIFYSLVGMTHAPAFALAALLFLLLVRQRESASLPLAFAAGAVAGSAVLLRFSAVALLLPAFLAVGLGARRPARAGAVLAAGFTLPLLPLPLWLFACNGSFFRLPYGGRWDITMASPWNVLFAPTHGLFQFHPALLFAAAGLLLLIVREIRRRELSWGGIAGVWFFAVALLHGWWSEWANPGAYGQRFLIDALPALAVGFATWLHPARAPRWRAGAVLAGALVGYILFFTAVGDLVPVPPPYRWPQRLSDYAVLMEKPPGPGELLRALGRASFLFRSLAPG